MAKITRQFEFGDEGPGFGHITKEITRYDFMLELAVLALLLVCLIGAAGRPDVQVEINGAESTELIPAPQDARTFAALQVYRRATADDWLQRAVIAQTTLNALNAGGSAQFRGGAAAGNLDPIAWQNALDAVDAVMSGDYPVPDDCARATAVYSSADRPWPGSQCVVRDLVFAGDR